jgi:hypothetical protein
MDGSYYQISNAVHQKNGDVARQMYGTKVAKELRNVLRRVWNGRPVSKKDVFFAMRRAAQALKERNAA